MNLHLSNFAVGFYTAKLGQDGRPGGKIKFFIFQTLRTMFAKHHLLTTPSLRNVKLYFGMGWSGEATGF
ncbi:MAG: hypothetical protein COX62_08855 [Deltaproteobacteria bacterium CG_4_10_14_0_2_um_filter_43_8]|nr:MAG: hypothetical protein COV43_07795 [Deltaproteobacteria bacterium CG11_big_fil_rev_8_21_14_0_20_42_23]PJA18309.1 MAG: hypothetical protein COX62_08855 [Deltaproteobacteria bacterium CG_4_10_14_0_2_um_filter_43_8]PJC63454.1 MAG: hypothetical protein CO021_09415 [Deltaproteobacteria bacterium CG_4_9_14_0_2_um_filter_42_21]